MPQPQEDQIIQTIKKVMPVVVSIAVSKKLEHLEKELAREYPPPFQDMSQNFPSDKVDAHGMVQVGGGSGFIVSADGVILTNKHVISEPFAEYSVITGDSVKHKAVVLARDPMDDIAVLKIETKKKFPAAKLDTKTKLELGQTVLAFGNALGTFKNTVSMGIISGLSRAIEAQIDPAAKPQEYRGLIQTDAAVNPGNSGGPLTNARGDVIGIMTAIIATAQNISFAIPIKAAERDLQDLKKFGKIKRPLLGLRYLTLNKDIAEKLGLPVKNGALVTKEHPLDVAIAPQSPADKAGLQEQDIILEWNGQRLTEEKTIQDFLETSKVGDTIQLKTLRAKREVTKTVILIERK